MVQKEKNNSLNLVETQVTEIVKRVDKPKRSKRSNGEGSFCLIKINGKTYTKGRFSNLNKKNGRCEHTGKTKTDIREKHQKNCVEGSVILKTNKSVKIIDAIQEILNKREQKENLQSSTMRKYRSDFKLVKKFFGSMPLSRLNKELIELWEYQTRETEGRVPEHLGKFMKMIFRSMLKYKMIDKNPIDETFSWSEIRTHKKIKVFKIHELKALFDATENFDCNRCPITHRHGYKIGIELQAFLGLRASEMLGLIWEDVDLQKGYIDIRYQLDLVTKERKHLKTVRSTVGGIRTLPIGPNLQNILSTYKQEYKPKEKDFILVTGNSVCSQAGNSGTGNAVDLKNYTRAFKRLVKQAGLDSDFTSHCLRHTFATTVIVEHKMDVAAVAYQLGHSNTNTTLKYYLHYFQMSKDSKQSPTYAYDKMFDM